MAVQDSEATIEYIIAKDRSKNRDNGAAIVLSLKRCWSGLVTNEKTTFTNLFSDFKWKMTSE